MKKLLLVSSFALATTSANAHLGKWLGDRTGVRINKDGISVSVSPMGGDIGNGLEHLKKEITGQAARERTEAARRQAQELEQQIQQQRLAHELNQIREKTQANRRWMQYLKEQKRILLNLLEQHQSMGQDLQSSLGNLFVHFPQNIDRDSALILLRQATDFLRVQEEDFESFLANQDSY